MTLYAWNVAIFIILCSDNAQSLERATTVLWQTVKTTKKINAPVVIGRR